MSNSEDDGRKIGELSSLAQANIDINISSAVMIMELTLALHDAGILDKKILADRLTLFAERKDIELSDNARTLILLNATGLYNAGGKKE